MKYIYIYIEQLKTTLRIAEKVNGQPSETTQHRMKIEKIRSYKIDIRRGRGSLQLDREKIWYVFKTPEGLTFRNKTRDPFLGCKCLVTFHLSPSYPRTGRGSNTFLEREQKLCIVQGP